MLSRLLKYLLHTPRVMFLALFLSFLLVAESNLFMPKESVLLTAHADDPSLQDDSDTSPTDDEGDSDDEDENDEEKKKKKDGHSEEKQEETDTPIPEVEKTTAELFDEGAARIKNPDSNRDITDQFPEGFARKWQEAEEDAQKVGKTLDLVSGKYIKTAEISKAYDQLESTIRKMVVEDPSQLKMGLETLALTQAGMRLYNDAGAARDFYGTSGPGKPGLELSQQFTVKTLNNFDKLLSDSGNFVVNTGNISPLNIAKQEAFQFADYTSITQGDWGSCWTCSANAYLWAERPDVASDAINQVLFTNQYRAGSGSLFVPGGANWPSGNEPSQSNLAYDFSETGEQSYAGRLIQQVVGVVADEGVRWVGGPRPPWEGGVPEYASVAVGKMIGDTNYAVPNLREIGGIPALEAGINDGTYRVVQYIPFPGHSASQSGRLLPTTDGGWLGFGTADNSWGTNNEHLFLATAENRGKWKFPGGGGSRFAGPGSGGSGFAGQAGSMASALGGLGGLQNNGASSSMQSSQRSQVSEQKAREIYAKMRREEKVSVRNVCIQNIRPGTGVPNLCKAAITDKSLPKVTPRDLFPNGPPRDAMIATF